ncbi:hypothetical protein Cgig2_010890 [Carnegiea gigantea]|uniref:Uncharacterized protein n=1 Tax=Carnegiea gigantea TaxID=171969 RepID=A0A9Q1H037_9CARY|nr:hypothetical protein Cgig2_010890 [Carnegiea gigantea]
MEKVLQPYDKEFMRMAMLKHEETFREQVYELHRLYRIQKMLMNSEVKQQGIRQKQDQDQRDLTDQVISQRLTAVDNQRLEVQRDTNDQVGLRVADDHHQERIAESNNQSMMLEESEIELTLSLGPTTYNPNRRPRTDKSESGQSVSSSSTGSSQTRKTSPKNSTSTRDFTWGGKSSNSITNNTFPHKGSESDPGFSNGQQNNPPWMFQALSLKLS